MVDDPATPIDEAHNFEPHHDRHVWLYRENPNGVFAPFNPAGDLRAPRARTRSPQPPRRQALNDAATLPHTPIERNTPMIRIAHGTLEVLQ